MKYTNLIASAGIATLVMINGLVLANQNMVKHNLAQVLSSFEKSTSGYLSQTKEIDKSLNSENTTVVEKVGCIYKAACNYDPTATVWGPGASCHFAHLQNGIFYSIYLDIKYDAKDARVTGYSPKMNFFPQNKNNLDLGINFRAAEYPKPNTRELPDPYNAKTDPNAEMSLFSFDIAYEKEVKNYTKKKFGVFSRETVQAFHGISACGLEKELSDFEAKEIKKVK